MRRPTSRIRSANLGGGEVYVVDAGDKQHQQPHDPERQNVREIPRRRDLFIQVRTQVDIEQRLGPERRLGVTARSVTGLALLVEPVHDSVNGRAAVGADVQVHPAKNPAVVFHQVLQRDQVVGPHVQCSGERLQHTGDGQFERGGIAR